jgi:hypothetical protein
MDDISGLENVNEIYQASKVKKWIKLIATEKTTLFSEYKGNDRFYPIADIVLDNDLNKIGEKKRKTLIKFVPKIEENEFNKKKEWLYLFVINDRIVKIGGTRDGIKNRTGSYLCGHHVEERDKSGDCSKTNGFIYNTFEFYLKLGCKIEMYGCELPKHEITVVFFENTQKVPAQSYHIYESMCLTDYKKVYNFYPILCKNCDPEFKN